MINVRAGQPILIETGVQNDFLAPEGKILFLNAGIALTELAVGKYLLELLPRVDHVFRVVDVWEEAVDPRLELRLGLWERPVEFVIEEHQIHDPVV